MEWRARTYIYSYIYQSYFLLCNVIVYVCILCSCIIYVYLFKSITTLDPWNKTLEYLTYDLYLMILSICRLYFDSNCNTLINQIKTKNLWEFQSHSDRLIEKFKWLQTRSNDTKYKYNISCNVRITIYYSPIQKKSNV